MTAIPDTAPLRLHGVSVVLPAHDEEANIVEAIREALAAAEPVSRRQEVIVVDDGSRDATAALAAGFAERDARVRLVRHRRNQGYGSAVRSGIQASRLPWVLLTDADLQFDLRQLRELVPYTEGAELVVGYRAQRRDPFVRRVNARLWNAAIHLLLHLPVRDVDCAFKLVRRDVLDRIALTSTGATIDTELIAKATRAGARIVERPVRHRPRRAGEASGANPRVVARALRELLRLWLELRERPGRPLRPAPLPR